VLDLGYLVLVRWWEGLWSVETKRGDFEDGLGG
jgi:hypothetical protein